MTSRSGGRTKGKIVLFDLTRLSPHPAGEAGPALCSDRCGRRGGRRVALVVKGALTLDVNVGRRTRPLGPIRRDGLRDQHGRLHHSCFGEDGELMVYDVWESQEAFQAFGAKLMPILVELGIDVGEPSIMAVHLLDQQRIEGKV